MFRTIAMLLLVCWQLASLPQYGMADAPSYCIENCETQPQPDANSDAEESETETLLTSMTAAPQYVARLTGKAAHRVAPPHAGYVDGKHRPPSLG